MQSLKEQMGIQAREEQGQWKFEWPELGVAAVGATEEEAEAAFDAALLTAMQDPAIAAKMREVVNRAAGPGVRIPTTKTELPDGRWRVEWSELGIEGIGATPEEAARNFSIALRAGSSSDPAVAAKMAELGAAVRPPDRELPEELQKLPSVTEAEFDQLISGDTPVLVDFWASWCGPCAAMAPALVELQEELGDSLKVVKVDVEAETDLARRCEISAVPTLLLYREGALLHRIRGAHPLEEIKTELAPFMA